MTPIASFQIPQELITDILLCCPVKSILRFRCVSQSLSAIIDSRDFINTYLKTSSEDKILRKLIYQELRMHRNNEKYMGFLVCDINDPASSEEKILIEKPRDEILKPCGYCNGLFLLRAGFFGLVLLNPSTKKWRNLPRCPVKPRQEKIRGLGLGYDSTRDDYKVVLINKIREWGCQVWMFGLRSNTWTRIQDFPYQQNSMSNFAYFAHGGDLHWLCKREYTSWVPDRELATEQRIVAFDVARKSFSQMTQPVYPTSEGYLTGLHVLDGNLCISFFSYAEPEEAVLYVRRKDGADQFTWSTLYSVTKAEMPSFLEIDNFKNVKVLGYFEGENKIMLDFGFAFMVSYDLIEEIFAKTDIRGASKYGDPTMLSESLLSVGTTTES